jgi:hypothetical protein
VGDVNDKINLDTAARLIGGERPMACCPRDDEPLVSTLEFPGAEFICVVCGTKYGFLAPTPRPSTPELWARYEELKEQWDNRHERNK